MSALSAVGLASAKALGGAFSKFSSSTLGSSVKSALSSGSSRSSSGSQSARMGDTLSSMTAALDQIYKVSERNSARSEAQAAELRDWQQRQNQLAMDFNSSEAAKNRDWQQMMSNTAHQREVADLRAAGLNPVLSASGGQGAAVTSGATASGVTSSGAMGQTDMSTTQALVTLLGTLWAAQTQVEMQRASAENNLAIAERQAQASQAVAHIQGQYSMANTQFTGNTQRDIAVLQSQTSQEVARIAGQYNLSSSQIYAAASKCVAEINAGASLSIAEIQATASKYAADQHLSGVQTQAYVGAVTDLVTTGMNNATSSLNSIRSAQASMYGSDRSYESSIYGADSAADVARRGQNFGLAEEILGDLTQLASSHMMSKSKKRKKK